MKIVLFNNKYSPNLGDGVAAECLEHALQSRLNDIEVETCDLDGRTGFSGDQAPKTQLALQLAPKLPKPIRKELFNRYFAVNIKRTVMPVYREKMKRADLAIFGAGQLFADDDLSLPFKVAAAAAIVRDDRKKIAVHSVGVDQNWTEETDALFKEAFAGAEIVWASVRDDRSRVRWRKHFKRTSMRSPRVSLDPGLLAPSTFGAVNGAAAHAPNRPRIGLCITAPGSLPPRTPQVKTGEQPATEFAADAEFYTELAVALMEKGYEVLAFTNGSAGDEKFLRHCFPKRRIDKFEDGFFSAADCPARPADLVETIKRCQGVIAHRLHANILAYAYQIPHVGLCSDDKNDEFFHITGRSQFVAKGLGVTPTTVTGKMEAALEAGIPDDLHHYVVKKTNQEIDLLAQVLKTALAEPEPETAAEKSAGTENNEGTAKEEDAPVAMASGSVRQFPGARPPPNARRFDQNGGNQ